MVGQSVRRVDGGRIPGPAAVPGVIEIKCVFLLSNGKLGSWNIHGQNVGSFVPSVVNANTIMQQLSTNWVTRFTNLMHNAVKWENCQVRDMTVPTNPVFVSNLTAVTMTGTGTTAMPSDVSLVLTEKANVRGRGASGRIYLPGWSTAADTGAGIISGPTQVAANGFGNDIMSVLNTEGLTPCVPKPARAEYIGLTGAHHNARSATFATILQIICQDLEWDTQRRRGQ